MLTCHIDIEIIRDAENEFRKDPRRYSKEFINFLEKECDLVIYGFSTDIDNEFTQENAEILDLYCQGIENNNSRLIEKSNLKYEHYSNSKSNPYQIFFFNESTEFRQIELKKKIPLLVGFIDNYNDIYNKFGIHESIRMHFKDKKNELNNFSQFFKELPITEMIISDEWLLKSYPNYPLEYNYYSLLRHIKLSFKYIEQIVVFSYDDKRKRNDTSNLDEIIKKSKEILGHNIHFRFVQYRSGNTEHDRHIFTNYFRTNLGSSSNRVNNQDGEKQIGKSSSITIFPYNKASDITYAFRILDDLWEKMESENKALSIGNQEIYKSPLFINK